MSNALFVFWPEEQKGRKRHLLVNEVDTCHSHHGWLSFPRKRESTMETYYAYILPSPKRGTLYIGVTND